MSDSKDKRTAERAILTSEVDLEFPNLGGFISAYSDNISEGGIFIITDELKPIGTLIEIKIKLQSSDLPFIQAKGVVAWRKEPKPGQVLPGFGIKFTELSDDSRKNIKRIVELNREVSATTVAMESEPENLTAQPQTSPPPPTTSSAAPPIDTTALADILYDNLAAKKGSSPTPPKTLPRSPVVVNLPPKPVKQSAIVIGIDLGTTNSCVAYVKDGQPTVIPSSLGYMTTPSMVAISPKGKILVGQLAYDQIVTNPTNTIYGSKRLIGRPFNSPIVQQMKSYFTYEIVEGDDHQVAVRMGEKTLSLPEVAAHILTEIKDVAQGNLDAEISDAIISVPAYYNDNQRNAVKRAGALAGLNVLRIINEPTAAAMAYGFNRALKERVLVYDLGGGTFDVSVLEISGNVFKVIATGGDSFLGGADFDRRIIFEIVRRFKEQHQLEISGDKVAMQRVKNAAEKAKKELSFQDETAISLPYITRKGNQPVDLTMTFTRKELESLTTDLVRRTLDISARVLEAKKLKTEALDEILLVGGQTRMPLVRRMAESFFGKEPRKGVHPDEVVALGASLLADSLKRESTVKLQDVLSMPIGIAIPGGKFKMVVDRNTQLPHRKDYKLSNLDTSQPKFEIDIYQGDSDKIIENEYLGTFSFDMAEVVSKAGEPLRMAMAFSLNEESLLTVVATDQRSGRSFQSIMTTKDTPGSLREAIQLEMKKRGKGDRGVWIKDFAKKVLGR